MSTQLISLIFCLAAVGSLTAVSVMLMKLAGRNHPVPTVSDALTISGWMRSMCVQKTAAPGLEERVEASWK
jgi:hypothetical protein